MSQLNLHPQIRLIGYIAIVFYLSISHVQAEELCRPLSEIIPPRPTLTPIPGENIRLFADTATGDVQAGTGVFKGNVLVQRLDQILRTETLNYDYEKEIVSAEEGFTLWDKGIIVQGHRIKLTSDSKGEMYNAHYWLLDLRGRGSAEKAIQETKEIIHLDKTTYTTCDPENEVWQLEASQTTLDHAKAEGVSRNAKLRLYGVPIFYSPYLSYPLNDARKSGFLPPTFGSSNQVGMEMSLPYYWNLASNYDATLTTRMMTRRGVLLRGELRYLTEANEGILRAEYMPDDMVFGRQRSLFTFKHSGLALNRWRADIDWSLASDNHYFKELGNNVSIANVTHLEQRGDLLYMGNGWNLLSRLQRFQSIDPNPAARPYQRLPQFLFNTTLPEINRQINLGLQAEWVRFERDTQVVAGATGERSDIQASFSYPWRTPGIFVVPKISLRHTRYTLSDLPKSANLNPQRTAFTASVDNGLFFDREITLFNTPLINTLEPRIFYRYTPYYNQDAIPIFDTALYDISFGQLFRNNRFSGSDRVDDGHQVTLAVSSRLLNRETGTENWRASIGQVYYLRDRKVTLPGQPQETDVSSAVIMEMATQFARYWSGAATVHWNPHTNHVDRNLLRVRYHVGQDYIVNLAYRLRENGIEQMDVSGYWQLNSRWSVLGRWNYSLRGRSDLDTFFGVGYESCCWAIRGIVRQYLSSIDSKSYVNGFFLEFVFNGLGGVGKKADIFLRENIPGYNNKF